MLNCSLKILVSSVARKESRPAEASGNVLETPDPKNYEIHCSTARASKDSACCAYDASEKPGVVAAVRTFSGSGSCHVA